MKNWFWFCLVILSFTYLGCENENILPPATSLGYNTFGCVVDGELFKCGLYDNGDAVSSYYSADSTRISGNSYIEGFLKTEINISLTAKNIDLEEGKTYRLDEPKSGQAYGEIRFDYSKNGYTTGGDQTGEWTITKLDKTNKIISGFFWFNVVADDGKVYKVTRGRFDLSYASKIRPIDSN